MMGIVMQKSHHGDHQPALSAGIPKAYTDAVNNNPNQSSTTYGAFAQRDTGTLSNKNEK
jgi:hypothetical protein